ncbi:MAG: hypothetical protein ABL921_34295, partial [Pirellula sp.]
MSPSNASRNTVVPTTYGSINKSRTGDGHRTTLCGGIELIDSQRRQFTVPVLSCFSCSPILCFIVIHTYGGIFLHISGGK